MNKTKLIIGHLCSFVLIGIYLSIGAHSVYAAGPAVSIIELPEYMNTDNFNISYSALAPAGLKNVTLQFHKEGDSWQTLAIFTTNADSTSVSGRIGSDGTYYFSATACDDTDVCTTDNTQTKIDRIAPPKVANFSSDRLNDNTYRLRWLNPNSDDLFQVYIYRGDHLGFNADSGSQVGTLTVTKDTNSEWNNNVPADGKNYYYLLRTIDRAGNASEVWGDMLVSTYTTSSAPSPTSAPVSGNESFNGANLALSPAVLGTTAEVTPEPTVTPTLTPTPESAISAQVNEITKAVKKTSPIWPILGFVAIAAAIYWFVGRKPAVKKPKISVKTSKKK